MQSALAPFPYIYKRREFFLAPNNNNNNNSRGDGSSSNNNDNDDDERWEFPLVFEGCKGESLKFIKKEIVFSLVLALACEGVALFGNFGYVLFQQSVD